MKERISEIPFRTPPTEQPTPLKPIDLSALPTLARDELEALCARLLCASGGVEMMTEEQTAQAMLDVLAATALRPIISGGAVKADIQARMVAVEKWLNRIQGTAVQRTAMIVKTDGRDGDSESVMPNVDAFLSQFLLPLPE
jgi:LDH2 family malate/lactate/ureidoglycolate dehydrogenase